MVTYEDLLRTARTLRGRSIPTIGKRARFRVEVLPGPSGEVIYCTPESTGKPRLLGAETDKALEIYRATGSRSPSSYTHVTVNSVYILALIRECEGR